MIESTLEELDENVDEESELDWFGVSSDPKLMTNPSGRELLKLKLDQGIPFITEQDHSNCLPRHPEDDDEDSVGEEPKISTKPSSLPLELEHEEYTDEMLIYGECSGELELKLELEE